MYLKKWLKYDSFLRSFDEAHSLSFLVNWLLTTPQQDGGDWQLLVDLIEKYGIVPMQAMPEEIL